MKLRQREGFRSTASTGFHALSRTRRFPLTVVPSGVMYWPRPVVPTCQTDSNEMASRLGSPPKHVTSSIKEADMLRQQKTLAFLHEELRTLALFDRVREYTIDPDAAHDRCGPQNLVQSAKCTGVRCKWPGFS